MSTELQEQFKNYVFEDVKENLAEWMNLTQIYGGFSNKLIELRSQYAKDNGLNTVLPLCPDISDLIPTVIGFRAGYVKRERSRLTEEYKPLAIENIANDEVLRYGLSQTFSEDFSESRGEDIVYGIDWELRGHLESHYDEIKHTLSNPARCIRPAFHDLANELLTSLFTVSLNFKDSYLSAYGDFETIEEAS